VPIATAWGWLVSVGVQQGVAAFGALVAVAALLVLFYLGARGARPLSWTLSAETDRDSQSREGESRAA